MEGEETTSKQPSNEGRMSTSSQIFGEVQKYAGGDWEAYTEQLDFYFIANGVKEPKTKKAILLANLPPETFQLLKDLLVPSKPKDDDVTYEVIVKKLKDHTKPERSALVARYEFDNRIRKPEESVSAYVATLKHLAVDCKFTDEMRQERLRDRLVSGIKDDKMLREMLKEKLEDLSFDVAVRKCLAVEQANKDVRAFRNEAKPEGVNILKSSSKGKDKQKPAKSATTGSPPEQQHATSASELKCYRCEGRHAANNCPFIRAKCHGCGKRGHLKKVCRQSKASQSTKDQPLNAMQADSSEESDEDGDPTVPLFSVGTKSDRKPIMVDLEIDNREVSMELDTGSAVSVMSETTYTKLLSHVSLEKTPLKLHTFTGEKVTPLGMFYAQVRLGSQEERLPLYVTPGKGPTLLGREWLNRIQLNWPLLRLQSQPSLQEVLDKHSTVFADELGKLKEIKARIQLKEGATPRFCKARSVSLARKQAVENNLDALEAQGIIKKVAHSDWAAPIVTPVKKNGDVRICGDFKVTVNPYLDVDEYPLPRIEEIYANLSGGKQFSTLDLRQAYLQMELEEDSKPYLTINTTRGLYQYQRLPYGVASAPAIWQRAMDQVLQGITGVQCYLDDIIVTGKSQEEHLKALDTVLQRLEEYGLKANKEKCKFLKDSVEYLGHVISAEGLHQSPKKVKAIAELPAPENVGQLRSFLGMVQYYARFLPDLATCLAPLNRLLQKAAKWRWGEKEKKSFEMVKQMLLQDRVLTHFDPDLPVVLACDSSSYGLGAVLSHKMPDGSERPVAFASRSLTKTEKKFAQIEKEALSLYWGVRKFKTYLEGRHFMLITDHKPLKFIMDPGKAVPVTAAARIQRWCLFLGAFSYEIEHRGTKQHANCDGLSRLPLAQAPEDKPDEVELFHVAVVDTLPVTERDLRKETSREPLLSRVVHFVESGWEGAESHPDIAPYLCRKDELTVHRGILMWGNRVVVPPRSREKVLDTLHEGHLGVVKMKGVARGYVWWPQIDREIEEMAKQCSGCQEVARNPSRAPLHRWEYPAQPWQRLHVDFAGPVQGEMLLVVADAHSKWLEVFMMRNTTALETVSTLRSLFARMGLPDQLVSDNGPQFTSDEFKQFCTRNGIQHATGAPYHPATNGLAERMVQSLKNSIKADKSARSLQHKIDRFLFAYRRAPHATTGHSPAQLLFGRQLRSRLDLLTPLSVKREVDKKLLKDETRSLTSFTEGATVWVRNYRGGPKWVSGTVLERTGPLMYQVQVNDYVWRRHAEQMRLGSSEVTTSAVAEEPPIQNGSEQPADPLEAVTEGQPPEKTAETSPVLTESTESTLPAAEGTQDQASPTTPLKTTRYGRVVKPPVRFQDSG